MVRHRLKTVSLRGVNFQRLFGSQRALKTIEDFTQFEQRTAYFDGDIVIATKKGVNPLERGSQVDVMADFEEMLDLPPAPKLDLFGKLDPAKATPAEIRGQEIFFGKGQCASCHQPPYYTDNLLHDLRTERFFKPEMVNYVMEVGDGKIKTFALRGVKDNPPYLHDERLLTLDDTVEFFNLVLGDKLTPEERQPQVPNPSGGGTGKRARKRSRRGGQSRQRTILKLCSITLAQYRDAEGPDRFCETKTGDAELLRHGRHRPSPNLFMQMSDESGSRRLHRRIPLTCLGKMLSGVK